jgi:hypothetical protein
MALLHHFYRLDPAQFAKRRPSRIIDGYACNASANDARFS